MSDEQTARAEALDQVRRILIENLKIDREPHEIEPDVPLFGTGLGLDSVDAVELLVALEGALALEMPEETQAPVHLRTVNTVVDFILEHRGHARALPLRTEPAPDPEMDALRRSTAFSRQDEMIAVRLSGADPFDALDPLVTNDLFMRDGQMRQGLLLDEHAHPIADVYVGQDDDDLLLLIEGMDGARLDAYLAESLGRGAELVPLHASHRFVSVHGPFAWELMGEVLGEDIIALPYLGFFPLEDETEGVCFRGGKTGEFGYDILLPSARVDAFVERLLDAGRAFDLREIGAETLARAKREAFFFDPSLYRDEDVTPLELQLRWRCSNRKDFYGSDALRARKATGRLTCLTSAAPLRAGAPVRHLAGTPAGDDGRAVGAILHAGACSAGGYVAHALLADGFAEVGLEHVVEGQPARAVSPPVIDNRSLRVDPRKHTYQEHGRGA